MRRVRLTSESVDFWVDLQLYEEHGEFLSVAWIAGDPEFGRGADCESAILDSLRSLGTEVARALMADKQKRVTNF